MTIPVFVRRCFDETGVTKPLYQSPGAAYRDIMHRAQAEAVGEIPGAYQLMASACVMREWRARGEYRGRWNVKALDRAPR